MKNSSARRKSIIWELCGGIILFTFVVITMRTEEKNDTQKFNEPALIGNIVYADNFNNDCLNIWIEIGETTEIVVNSIIFKITSTTIDNKKAIQIIKTKNPKQIGEEMFFIENIGGWQRETSPATKEDIEMMSIINKKLKKQ